MIQTILHLDNSPPGAAERAGMLRNAGYVVIEGDPRDASQLLEAHSPALVIADSGILDAKVPCLSASGMELPVLINVVGAYLRMASAENALRRWNRDIEELSFAMRHDLQEPLRAINIYTDLLSTRLSTHLDVVSGRYDLYVRSGVERMERLILDLLEFSRLMHGEPAASGVVDLEEVLASVTEGGVPDVQGASITHDRLPRVIGDEILLQQVFRNLLSNAIKYRKPEEPAVVHVSADRRGQWWGISVRDNGMGFEPQYAERIFGLFKRLHGKEYPGTGLGLALCRQVVEHGGGRIWAESEPGRGSVFLFTLPGIPAIIS